MEVHRLSFALSQLYLPGQAEEIGHTMLHDDWVPELVNGGADLFIYNCLRVIFQILHRMMVEFDVFEVKFILQLRVPDELLFVPPRKVNIVVVNHVYRQFLDPWVKVIFPNITVLSDILLNILLILFALGIDVHALNHRG